MGIAIPLVLLLILNYAAGRWGYKSRDGFEGRAQQLPPSVSLSAMFGG